MLEMQINKRGFSVENGSKILDLQMEFEQNKCVVLPNLIELSLAENIVQKLNKAEFYPNEHLSNDEQEFATDLTIRENNIVLHQIHLLLNNPILFQIIQQITVCDLIGSFSGRIYRNLPYQNHQLDWHDDTSEEARLIGISINLSKEKYSGGCFQIQEKKSQKVLREVCCQNLGDAHIFQISTDLQHRVTPTSGEFPRTSAAGWFVFEPQISEVFKNLYR